MKVSDSINALKDRDLRQDLNQEVKLNSGIAELDDDALSTISGGCAPTTPGVSCVPPGVFCP